LNAQAFTTMNKEQISHWVHLNINYKLYSATPSQAASPKVILERKWANCTDMSVALIYLLATHKNIKAHLVMVNTHRTDGYHMIARLSTGEYIDVVGDTFYTALPKDWNVIVEYY
jgi:hypothetical protein